MMGDIDDWVVDMVPLTMDEELGYSIELLKYPRRSTGR